MTFRTFILAAVALAAATAAHLAAAQVTDGCSAGTGATAANGFFTLDSACFGIGVTIASAPDDASCDTLCTGVGLTCDDNLAQRSAQDCDDMLTAYRNSAAAPADMPADLDIGAYSYCTIVKRSDDSRWTESVHATGMPMSSMVPCTYKFRSATNHDVQMLVCECTMPDATAPTLSGITGAQASSSTVTVSGTTDEAGTVYCGVASSPGLPDTTSSLKAGGQSTTVASPGSFTVTVTGVSGDGSKVASCIGEDASNNVSDPPATSSSFHFGTCNGVVCAGARGVQALTHTIAHNCPVRWQTSLARC